MAIIKCKMCGGNLNLVEGISTAECEYCGSIQTVPKVDDEKKLNLFTRANRLRAACDFDKAAGIYEAIVADFPEEAEAYWGLVLCKYGIEYVDDPATGKKIPTCHRSGFESVMKDTNVELAQEYADVMARRIYRAEAKQIEELRKEIIAVSATEKPYDVFICYKETDFYGKRTLDSVLAQDIYDALTNKGYRVFFSRISLEDKLGTEYEPYIFAALNSAKIMLTVGTDYEHFNAVWVKNEWSRFLKLMAQDKSKHLIPCYKGIDAYDMPEEFARLQAQDLDKVGAIQDIVRGVQKLLPKQEQVAKENVVIQQAIATASPLLERAFIFLEDDDWEKADDFCEQVLNLEPKNAMAYLGKLMAEQEVSREEQLAELAEPFDDSGNYQKALRYADKNLQSRLKGYLATVVERKETERMKAVYWEAQEAMRPKTASAYNAAARLYERIPGYKDAATLAAKCRQMAQQAQKDETYEEACSKMYNQQASAVDAARRLFESIPGWKDADEKAAQCRILFEQRKAQEDADRIAREKTVKRLTEIRQKYAPIHSLYAVGSHHIAAINADGTVVATGCNAHGQLNVFGFHKIVALAAGLTHTLGLREDGSVIATQYTGSSYSGQCNVAGWKDITAIAAGGARSFGLTKQGTVLAVGNNNCHYTSKKGPCQVSDWKNIAQIRANSGATIGITQQGNVLAVGNDDKCNISMWKNIIDVCDSDKYRAGLRSDGTVVAIGKGLTSMPREVSSWKNIIQLAPVADFIMGLKDDGTVVIMEEARAVIDVSEWTDIVAIATAYRHAVGLKADGTVVAAGSNLNGQLNVSEWSNIVSIGTNWEHVFGVRADGTVVVSGDDGKYNYNVSHWKLFSSVDTLEEDRAFAQKQAQWRSVGLCRHCGGELKGFFSKKCVSCGKPKDY